MTTLATLLPDATVPAGLRTLAVKGIAVDSRKIEPGYLFFAVPGTKADGITFATEAIRQGAVAVVAERQPAEPVGDAPMILVDDVRRALAIAAAGLQPEQPRICAAITGTSGKTSVAAFCRQIWTRLGHSAASIGTIGIVAPAGATYGSLTTPDPIALHADLGRLARDGVTHLALEASSHGIEQKRLDGVRLTVAGFTNLSRDHLDYHGDVASYLAAKLRLFEVLLPRGSMAVINADSDVADKVISACRSHQRSVFTVGRAGSSLRLLHAEQDEMAALLTIEHAGHRFRTRLPLAGDFQVSNALVAAGLCLTTGCEANDVIDALATLDGAPGRLQLVGRRGAAPVFVDYAHKPDALEQVLRTLRPLTHHRLTVVFGCGGDRDRGKRPLMGGIAARLADRVVVTDDNPRSEDPAVIRTAILDGAKREAGVVIEIADRAEAIEMAVASLEDDDVLVIAGKGHETGQIVGTQVLPFSDLDCAGLALQKHAR